MSSKSKASPWGSQYWQMSKAQGRLLTLLHVFLHSRYRADYAEREFQKIEKALSDATLLVMREALNARD